MKHIQLVTPFLRLYILYMLLLFSIGSAQGQNIFDARQSVTMQATVQEEPPAILLSWVLDTANGGYTIWRKSLHADTWGDSLITLSPASTSWVDTTVSIGIGYEYQILKSLPAFPTGEGTKNTGAGYIYAGMKMSPTHHHGACLVVVDSTFKQSLAPEISSLLQDIEADGWNVKTLYVDRNDSVQDVKSAITSWAVDNPDTDQTVFLFGRVPVPYSGEIAPDGHHSDHRGAWPCDGYYAHPDGTWTDASVNTTAAASSRNDNVPGDGKFDNSVFPSLLKLQIGRVDFSNMNKFTETEEQLLRRYLHKDHAWRTGKAPAMERGLVDNNFGDLEGLGQSGWKNFAAMFGISNVKDLPYRQTLLNESYMWSYGCGGGGPESASDISSTTHFTTDSLQTIFTMLFGSYFGDWDYPNNFLRGAIASRTCLASTWGNRPNWLFHHMALGEHIGFACEITMNNRGLYKPAFYGNYVHTALMGDPTLRMHIQQPVENLIAIQSGLHVQLDWEGSVTSSGYFIYKKTDADSTFRLLNEIPFTGTTYTDPCPGSGVMKYMVRNMELRTSGSGSYYNLSAGMTIAFISDPPPYVAEAEITMADPGQSNGGISINPQGGCTPYTYVWDSGQTTPDIYDLAPGLYCVTVSDCLGCTLFHCSSVEVTSRVDQLPGLLTSRLFPNPANDQFALELDFEFFQHVQLDILDAYGRSMARSNSSGKYLQLNWDVAHFPSGIYWLRVKTNAGFMMLPFTRMGE